MIDPGFWRGRRVLLTGHTGFKGTWLALWLHALGARVTGFSGPPPGERSLFALARADELVRDRVRGDLRDAAAVGAAVRGARPEVVFHLAAQPLVRRSYADPVGTWETNVLGTARVLEAVRATAAGAAVVVLTSDKCYLNDGSGRAFREDDPLGGHDPYSASKAAQELVAASFRDAYGLRVATARAGNVIGGGDRASDRIVPDLVRAAESAEPLVLRRPDAVRPWQHVLNPLAGYLMLAERLAGAAEFARAFNFGPGADGERTVRWLVEQLLAAWPAAVDVQVDHGSGGEHEAPVLRLDSTLAHQRLGWEPRWDAETGVAETALWHAAVAGGEDPRTVTLEQIERFATPAPRPSRTG